jgi:hypothetical protein
MEAIGKDIEMFLSISSGDGDSDGSGYGSGDGDSDGSGYGDGIKEFNGQKSIISMAYRLSSTLSKATLQRERCSIKI